MEPTNMQPANMQPANIIVHPISIIKIDSEERKHTRYSLRAKGCSFTALKRLNKSSARTQRSHSMTTRAQARKFISIPDPQPKASKVSSMSWEKAVESLKKMYDVEISATGVATMAGNHILALLSQYELIDNPLLSPDTVAYIRQNPQMSASIDLSKMQQLLLLHDDMPNGTYQVGFGFTQNDSDKNSQTVTKYPMGLIYNKNSNTDYKTVKFA